MLGMVKSPAVTPIWVFTLLPRFAMARSSSSTWVLCASSGDDRKYMLSFNMIPELRDIIYDECLKECCLTTLEAKRTSKRTLKRTAKRTSKRTAKRTSKRTAKMTANMTSKTTSKRTANRTSKRTANYSF